MKSYENFEDIFKGVGSQKEDDKPSPPQEKIVETICPCCQKKLRLKVKF